MMPFSGVRISWLIVARNSPLAITADSATCLASSSSRSRLRWISISLCSDCMIRCCSSDSWTTSASSVVCEASDRHRLTMAAMASKAATKPTVFQ